mgnify:FL=1
MIHPTAIIEPGAQLGVNVSLGPYAHVAATARLGDGCVLDSHAVVKDYTTIGARCRLHAGAVIGGEPQDLSFKNEPSYVVTGDDCIFREGVTVNRGTKPGTTTRIGNHVFMMANSHAAHNCEVGDHVVLANGVLLAGYVTVGERAFLGGGVGVHQFCHIGRLAMVGAISVITKDLLPFCVAANCANSMVFGLNIIGLRRAGFTPEQRAQVKQAFHLLYRAGLNTTQAREQLSAATANPFAQEYAEFLGRAKRGICRFSHTVAADETDV